jgi:hypothetical protein
VFMQLCIKLIIMEESTKKIFKPKFELVQECMALFQYIWVSTLLRYFKGQNHWNHQEDHQMLVVCRTILRDIALNALGVRPEELCQDKSNLLYNLSDSLRWLIFKPLFGGMFISRKRAASFCLMFSYYKWYAKHTIYGKYY